MGDAAVIVDNLYKAFDDVKAIDGVSFSVQRNSIFGLLGSNGAGKSTMIHILTGLLNYDEGKVLIFDEDMKNHPKSLKRKVAIVPQKISLYDELSIYENLYFFGKAYGFKHKDLKRKIKEMCDTLKLGKVKRKIKFLSGGYQRRVSLAVSLIADPDMIILDEALVGIDIETRDIIVRLLKELKKTKTIIITTHSVREAESLCDSICFMHKGKKVFEGKTTKLLREHSKKYRSRLDIYFKDDSLFDEIKKLLSKTNIKVNTFDNCISLSFYENEFPILYLVDYMQKNKRYREAMVNIDIKKSRLEEIMLGLIKEDGS